MPQHHNDESCNYLFNFPDFPRTSVPCCRTVVGGSGGATGAQRWKLNPNIGGGGENKNRSFGVPRWQGVPVEKNRTYASRRRAYSSRHHGWRAPPEAKFFRARSLATIDTLPNWPKIRPFPQPKTAVFSPVDFIFPPMNRQCQCSQNVQPMQEPTTHTTDSKAVLDFHYAGGAAH